ncbi:polysaccharide ABC transporter ATP-binding protein [Gryllotalpicola sp.]|uniref:ABC transporter ATP-binding protein n=1 Tax=Gryllotalpicola sp. TaxID=1932787 RepID=UPI00261ABAF1|nr:polysaccharide ABC transporter ATP-binding protein [Gryllotalpicola sp.]
MSAPAIRVEGLGKRYRIGERVRYKSLRESVSNVARRALRGERRPHETIWALKDVSFEVQPGEVVGVIGRNGAGKSTLLKILSRITEPTEGRVELHGRVGSLLEVGTGFHQELTGRENIYLNGAILGMKRAEIERKFDEIVAFAEIERFLDTPVKHYSTGMYLRLAFAVAAHLEPEILLVDEVLAVGDSGFQTKCMGKMEEVGKGGRTVIFVSHNMAAVSRLCQRAVLLGEGRVFLDGPPEEVLATYLRSDLGPSSSRTWPDGATAPGNDVVRLRGVRVQTRRGPVTDSAGIAEEVGVEIEYEVLAPGHILVPNLHFFNEQGTYAFVVHDSDPAWCRRPRPVGRFFSTAWIPANYLAEGTLIVGAAISTHSPLVIHVYERDAVAFNVADSFDGTTARGDYVGYMPGVVRPLVPWETRIVGPLPIVAPARKEKES